MDLRVRAQHRRRLHAIGPGDGFKRRNRGRASASLRRNDAREGSTSLDGPATFLHAWAAQYRRPPRLRPAHALHSKCDNEALRQLLLAYLENNTGARRENCGWTD